MGPDTDDTFSIFKTTMKKIIAIILLTSLPFLAYASSVVITPTTASSVASMTMTSCTACVDGSGYSVIWLFDNSGAFLAGNFIVDLASDLPLNMADSSIFNSSNINGGIYALLPLANGNYSYIVTPYSGGASVTACETSYTACAATVSAAAITITIGSGGGGGGGPVATTTPVAGSVYMFLYTSVFIFIMELIAILVIFFIVAALLAWPIRRLAKSMKGLIRKA